MALGIGLCFPAQARAQNRAELVDRFLDQVGLVDLQIFHWEKELARPRQDAAKAQEQARRLADLYVSHMLALGDPKKIEEFSARLEALLTKYPQANTPTVQVVRLQGDYNRAEAAAAKWMAEPDDAKARAEASKILARITAELDRIHGSLQQQLKEVDAVLEKIEKTKQKAEINAKEQERNRLAQAAGRATYFSAWSNYYQGLLSRTQPGTGGAEAKKAAKLFRDFLGIERLEKGATAEELNISGEIGSRVALGLALAEMAAGDRTSSEIMFKVLASPEISLEVRDRIGYWQVWSLLKAGYQPAAVETAKKEIAAFKDAYTPGRAALCVLLVRTGFADKNKIDQPLGQLGLVGLVQLRRFDTVRQLIAKYEIPATQQNTLAMQMMTAQGLFDQAEKTKSTADYQKAGEAFQAALKAPDAKQDLAMGAQCQYMLGWSYFRAGQLDKALVEFKTAATILKAAKSPDAGNAAWMAIQTLMQMSKKSPEVKGEAVAALLDFKGSFPSHKNASRADLIILTLQKEMPSPDSLKTTDPNYPEACYFAAQMELIQWRKNKGAAKPVQRAAERFLGLAEAEKRLPWKLEGLHMLVELALAKPDLNEAQLQLSKADAVAGAVEPGARQLIDYHLLKMQLALALKDEAAVKREAAILAKKYKGSPAAEAGLINLARFADEAVKKAPKADLAAKRKEATDIYRQLVEAMGDAPEILKTNKNAVVACSRLANYVFEAEQYAEAAKLLDNLLVVSPRDGGFLRKAGLSHFNLKNFNRSLDCWTPLVNGIKNKESPEWYEAKYHQLASLAKVEANEAREIFKQYELLRPELGPSPWREAFQKLKKELLP